MSTTHDLATTTSFEMDDICVTCGLSVGWDEDSECYLHIEGLHEIQCTGEYGAHEVGA